MSKITYEDKVKTRTSTLPAINTAEAKDFNEIKTSVNALYDAIVNYLALSGGIMTGDILLSGSSKLQIENLAEGGYNKVLSDPIENILSFKDFEDELIGLRTGFVQIWGVNFLGTLIATELTSNQTYTLENSTGTIQSNSPRAWITLADAASIVWNYSLGYNAKVTLTANRALSAPTNVRDGDYGTLKVFQDAIGSRTLTLPANFEVVNNGGGIITLTTAPLAYDLITWVYDSALNKFTVSYGNNPT